MENIEANKALIKRVYAQGFSDNNVDIMDEAFGPSYTCRFPGLPPIVGLPACKLAIGSFLRAFPASYTVEQMVGEGDRVVARWSAVGVHAGPFTDMADSSPRSCTPPRIAP
jgi:hypothetical protein